MSYAYNAAMICDACANTAMAELDAEGIEDEGDTDSYPQYANSSEADSPQHCDHCGEFLENDLTGDGVEYVKGLIAQWHSNSRGDEEILRQWAEFYGLNFDLDDEGGEE